MAAYRVGDWVRTTKSCVPIKKGELYQVKQDGEGGFLYIGDMAAMGIQYCSCWKTWEHSETPSENPKPKGGDNMTEFKVGDKVRLTENHCDNEEPGDEGTVEHDRIRYTSGPNRGLTCSEFKYWELISSVDKPMAKTLTKLQEQNLSDDAKALVKAGVLRSDLTVYDDAKLTQYFIQITMKALADLARAELAEEEANKATDTDE